MKITVNGKTIELPERSTVADLVRAQGIAAEGTAVAIAGRVVPRGEWTSVVLQDGQEIMVIRAVCGG